MDDSEYIEILGYKFKTIHVVFLLAAVFVGWLIMHWFFSVEIPGHWNEKGSYETQVYVNLFPEDEKAKNYRLVGEVERYSECDDYDETTRCYNGYRLRKIMFPNKGYLEFDDCEIILNKKERCSDYDGNSWNIELTNQKP